MYVYVKHFVTLARMENRKGLTLRKSGTMAAAFCCFVRRDMFIERARGE